LVQDDYKDFSGNLYDDKDIDVIAEEARGFVGASDALYDLIQLVLFDSFSASSAGLYALSESYLYTVEAFQEYLEHLRPEGYLAISRWIKLPPRDTLKLFATAIEALRRNGIQHPEQHLILIRGLQTSTLLIKNTAIKKDEIASVQTFCNQRSFDTAYYPGMPSVEANRYNVLSEPYFYIGTTAMLGDERDIFMERYKFNLEPATDDQPFFFHFFKWRVLPEILSLVGKGGMPLLEWGYLILIATLVQALFASFFLILLPLFFYRRKKEKKASHSLTLHSFVYFLSLGLAFLFVEIAFIQKFILFLHHPIYAISVVLAAFLIFAGMGSLWSGRFADTGRHAKGVKFSVSIIVVIGISYIFLLGTIFSLLISLPMIAKIMLSIVLIAPLAFCMGMPFPLGLSRLGEIDPGLVPWVWGVNGCASVLSAVLATLLAIHFGFTVVILSALVLYAFAAVTSAYWLHGK
ncbi:MAG: SAM-dependent methyltransferase, partial [Gammaproteobacteria bacterium]|nr:SAM-dependent methyltransferase [Gammaproteobacteria bacterium]